MPLSNISGSTEFNLNLTPKTLLFEDTTDYASASVTPADVAGCLTLTGPTGVFHNNTNYASPDIVPSVSTDFFKNLPLNGGGDVVQGDYSVEYRVRVTNNFSGTVSVVNQLTITGSDETAFFTPGTVLVIESGANAGSYTVLNSEFSAGNTLINLTVSTLVDGPAFSFYTYTFVVRSYNFTYCYAAPVIEIEPTVDCDCSKIVSRDLTNYNIAFCGVNLSPTSILRVHTVSAPTGQDGNPVASPIVSNLASVTVSPIWTGVWTSSVVTELSYTLPSGLIVNLTAAGQDSYEVSCSEGLCCVFQCMANLRNKYEAVKLSNPRLAEQLFYPLFRMNTAWMLYSAAANCGDFTNKRRYLDEIIDIAKSANCECCGETDSFPTQVVPVCGAASAGSGTTVVVDTCNNGITVTANTVGSTTTYQVCLDLDVLGQNIANYLASNPLSLGDLSDVVLTSPSTNQLLVFNGTNWVNGSVELGDLTGVTITSATSGDVLTWNGSAWVNLPPGVAFTKSFTIGSYTTAQSLNATGAYTNLEQTLALATGNNPLSANGDLVEFTMLFAQTSGLSNAAGFALNGTFIAGRLFSNTGSSQQILLKGTLTRISATQLLVVLESDNLVQNASASVNFRQVFYDTVTVANIGSTPLVISPWKLINAGSSDCVYANYKSSKK